MAGRALVSRKAHDAILFMSSLLKKLRVSSTKEKPPGPISPNPSSEAEQPRTALPAAELTRASTVSATKKPTILEESSDGSKLKSQTASQVKKYTLSDVKIERTLGTGSFGRVHLSKLSDGQYVALKVLKKAEVIKMRQLEHTVNERAILAQIEHPFLVKLYGTFQDSENVYFLLEYIQGGELFSYLRKCVVRTI